MIFTCGKFLFTLSRVNQPEQCPDCGKYAVREATEAEKLDYAKNLKEFQEAANG